MGRQFGQDLPMEDAGTTGPKGESGEDFWKFSRALYGQAEVEKACLDLQNRRGLNTNLVLFCCWAGFAGAPPLDSGDLSEAVDLVASWQAEVIQPLRWVRRMVREGITGVPKADAEPVRKQVLEAELEAERAEQRVLQRLLPDIYANPLPLAGQPVEARAARAAVNLLTYFAALRIAPQIRDREDMAVLVRAAAPDLSQPVVEALIAA